MPAGINDKITKVSSGVRPVSTTVSTIRNSGATTLACADLTGWTTTEVVFFVTYKIDGSGKVVVGSQSDWKGIVSGTNINNLVLTGGADAGNAPSDIVEMLPTAEYAKQLATNILAHANQDGTLLPSAVTTSLTGTTLPANTVSTTSISNASVTNTKLATGATRLGINKVNTIGTVLTVSYATYATVTATSTGRECEVDFRAVLGNGSSGADRSVIWRVQCDGVDVPPAGLNIGVRNGSPTLTDTVLSFIVSSTPTAGTHTWVLQLQASVASAVLLDGAVMKVSEIA